MERSRPPPKLSERALAERRAREARAAAALRANLRRRKQQAQERGRVQDETDRSKG